MKFSILLVFIFTSLFSFAQEEQNTRKNDQKTQTKKELTQNKKEVHSLQTHPFFKIRNEYIKRLIKVDNKIIPVHRTTETVQENVNRLIKWAHENKKLFKKDYRKTIDRHFKTINSK